MSQQTAVEFDIKHFGLANTVALATKSPVLDYHTQPGHVLVAHYTVYSFAHTLHNLIPPTKYFTILSDITELWSTDSC